MLSDPTVLFFLVLFLSLGCPVVLHNTTWKPSETYTHTYSEEHWHHIGEETHTETNAHADTWLSMSSQSFFCFFLCRLFLVFIYFVRSREPIPKIFYCSWGIVFMTLENQWPLIFFNRADLPIHASLGYILCSPFTIVIKAVPSETIRSIALRGWILKWSVV